MARIIKLDGLIFKTVFPPVVPSIIMRLWFNLALKKNIKAKKYIKAIFFFLGKETYLVTAIELFGYIFWFVGCHFLL